MTDYHAPTPKRNNTIPQDDTAASNGLQKYITLQIPGQNLLIKNTKA